MNPESTAITDFGREHQKTQGVSKTIVLSGHQPTYLPGIILFNKIALSDMFMFVGHCQYVKKSWHSRNRIRLNNQELWLSVPVRSAGRFDQSINETVVANDLWKRKHLGSYSTGISKAGVFKDYYPELEERLVKHSGSLADLNIGIIRMILNWLEVRTAVVDSRCYQINGSKTEMLISMCKAVGANHYLSNEGSRDYVDEPRMAEEGIQHCWQVFEHPTYPQSSPFMPNMSIIDLVFRMGPDAKPLVLNCGRLISGQCSPTRATA